jgi:hypothetical protein
MGILLLMTVLGLLWDFAAPHRDQRAATAEVGRLRRCRAARACDAASRVSVPVGAVDESLDELRVVADRT